MLELKVLGGLALEGPDIPDDARVGRRHPLALLAVVASARETGVPRERVMALLWPESDQTRASNSLRQILYLLRQDLGEDLFLPEGTRGLRLDPDRIRVDLWRFEKAVEADDVEAAVEAYGGPFLEGFRITGAEDLNHWVEVQRRDLQRRYHTVLERAAAAASKEGRLDDAVTWRERHAADDPFSSRAALALLEALVAVGDRTGALRYAGVYEQLVRSQLGVEPDPAVAEYVSALRDARPSEAPPSSATPGPDASAESDPHAPAPASAVANAPDGRWRWLAATAALAVIVLGAVWSGPGLPGAGPSSPSTIIVASGAVSGVERDPATRLVACQGPACPSGPLPQAAIVVQQHPYYAAPVAGTNYIAPVADATSRTDAGYPCCTAATFETEFRLPPEATSARLSLSLLADNRGRVSINGEEFGVHADSLAPANYVHPMNVFATVFVPDSTGVNRLRFVLEDYGGALGLHYHGTVTYELPSWWDQVRSAPDRRP